MNVTNVIRQSTNSLGATAGYVQDAGKGTQTNGLKDCPKNFVMFRIDISS